MYSGLFDLENRFEKIDANGDPLAGLNKIINWELFRPDLEPVRQKERKSSAGRKPYDLLLMFKILVLQSLYNLSDDNTEQQILDRLSFQRFLGLTLGDPVPDAKTIWLFREELNADDRARILFDKFHEFLNANGFQARKGQIVDAAIVQVPKQRNTHEENERIKEGEAEQVRSEWKPAKAEQKDTDARWTQKNGKNYFGYKHHDSVDVKHKLIRDYTVTSANVHDSQVFLGLLTENTSGDVYADSAYFSEEALVELAKLGWRGHIQRKGNRGHKLTDWEKQGNRTRASIRCRVEHVFGVMRQRMGDTVIRTIGIVRAKTKIGLRHLAYNLSRYVLLLSSSVQS
jgi:IS5 family transposase